MTSDTHRKRVEILVDTPLVRRIVAAARESGIESYTLFPAIAGSGSSGEWTEDQISGASSKVLFVAITRAEKAADLTTRLTPLLDDFGLVVILSDVEVIRSAKF